MSNGRIVTIAWYPPLTPARQRVFNVILLTIIPALTLWSAIWAATLFPYQPRAQLHRPLEAERAHRASVVRL